jgi:hypothetical protein
MLRSTARALAAGEVSLFALSFLSACAQILGVGDVPNPIRTTDGGDIGETATNSDVGDAAAEPTIESGEGPSDSVTEEPDDSVAEDSEAALNNPADVLAAADAPSADAPYSVVDSSDDDATDDGDGDGPDTAPDACTQVSLPPSLNIDSTQWSAAFKTSPAWNCNAAGTTTVDSAAGTITSTSCTLGAVDFTNNVAQASSGGPSVMVIRLQGLTVSNNHVIRLRGDKPIVFLVSGDVLVDLGGTIDAGAVGTSSGPGGSIANQCGASTGQPGTTGQSGLGGGGGGFGTAGGQGGRNTNSAGTVSTGTNLQPLRGGCSGGAADQPGGAGGGAFEISASGTITIGTGGNAAILSAAGGGSPGSSGGSALSSGGAGSGGAILLVAPSLATFGTQGAARVHGGGSGGASGQTTPGQDGHAADDNRATGGTSSDGNGATGASGGLCAGANCATASAAGADGNQGGGGGNSGGGGGGGCVQVITGTSTISCI